MTVAYHREVTRLPVAGGPMEHGPDLPLIGLTLGDPSGIGPEVCARVLASGGWREHVRLRLIGDRRVLDLGLRDAGVALPPDVPVLDLANADPATFPRGEPSAAAGRAAGETLHRAARLALEGEIDGLCYAPLNKGALNLGGWHFPDDLHLFTHLTGYGGPPGDTGELNVQPGDGDRGGGPAGELWTSRATSHIPLKDVAAHLTRDSVLAAIELVHRTLRRSGMERPRIAVAALNPHAGDGGLCGDEERTVIAPAIARAVALGVACEGPFAADTVFLRARAGAYDAVVSMYHDQGQIATKLLGFSRGVTVLAGLPVVLTTPAHGTAHDITGRGVADPGALAQAVRFAGRLARRRGAP
jgi:4-hydroxythreonine-4-phosphate dehydrogenase